MSKNVTVSWTLPTERQGGGALQPEDIEHVIAELSADGGAAYVELAIVLPTEPQQVFVPDQEPGEWHYRFTVFDTLGQDSGGTIQVVTVIDDSPPNNVTDITVTQE